MNAKATAARYFGKYRGTVINNVDPLGQLRLIASVPALPALANYALPCLPYGALLRGQEAMPPVGAPVWIEFEAGDPAYPVWSGCFLDQPAR